MPPSPPTSLTIIVVPHHVGLQNHRVGLGPGRILSRGLTHQLDALNLTIHTTEIGRVQDTHEGEMGRSFEVLRRISSAVQDAVSKNSFPIVLAGNCMSTVGISAGLRQRQNEQQAFVYLDAHDDFNTPDTNTNGYFDAMGLSMLANQSYRALVDTIPNFTPVDDFSRFLYCGLRDVTDVERQRVENAGMRVIWGGENAPASFSHELEDTLQKCKEQFGQADTLVHLDLDVLDQSEGLVNGYESSGGIRKDDLLRCLEVLPRRVDRCASLTVCSFNPEQGHGGDGDKIADIAVRAVVGFVGELLRNGQLVATGSK